MHGEERVIAQEIERIHVAAPAPTPAGSTAAPAAPPATAAADVEQVADGELSA